MTTTYRFHRRILQLLTACIYFLLHLPAHSLDFGNIPPDNIAVFAQDLHNGRIIVAHRADRAMNPASTMKLVTTFAALDTLSPSFRWQTTFKSDATIHNNTLTGNLYWQGSGDPTFDQKDLLAIQHTLHQQGIHNIDGKLILDDSIWPTIAPAAGFEDDAAKTFTTPPSPHMLAYKVVWITPQHHSDGTITIHTNPPLPNIALQTNLTPAPAQPCPSPAHFLTTTYQNDTLFLSGKLPITCSNKKFFINMLNSSEMATYSFINHWQANGNRINTAHMPSEHLKITSNTHYSDGLHPQTPPPHQPTHGKTPSHATILAQHFSSPLPSAITAMNTYSNNIIARSLFLTLGSYTNQAPETALRTSLSAHGIYTQPLIIENGSGLSRKSRLNARLLGSLLAKAYTAPFADDFITSLPQAGKDGTLKHRFTDIGSSLRLKTGTLKNVRALAGYWLPDAHHQHPIALVVLLNSDNSPNMLNDFDHFVRRLLNDIAQQEQTMPSEHQANTSFSLPHTSTTTPYMKNPPIAP